MKLFNDLKWKLYDVNVAIHQKMHKQPKGLGKASTRRRNNLIFYISMMALPIIQFVIMWGFTNVNTIILAFKRFDVETGEYYFYGFNNFLQVIKDFTGDHSAVAKYAVVNSVIVYAVNLLIVTPLGLLFSYYIYKKFKGGRVFRTILYIPSIVSSVVMVTIFTYFVENFIPQMMHQLTGRPLELGLLSNPETTFQTLLVYSVFFSFGSTTMIYSSSMSNINQSLVEAAMLDGCGLMQEFLTITIPLCFNIIKLNLATSVTGFFTNTLSLHTFYGLAADESLYTIGYFIQKETLSGASNYPYLSAYGLLMGLVVTPLVFGLKAILDKFDPYMEKTIYGKGRAKK
ncbi:MAG: sugar ABC transporter permease [Clostridia bacterium]|nr:sugar ABC transporter permease [Clostridia bacterium]